MSYTQDQLTKLKAAYARGVLRVREGDTWVEYQSMSSMRQAINDMESEISTGGRPKGTRLATVSKGYWK